MRQWSAFSSSLEMTSKWQGAVDMLECRAAIQRALDRLEEWAERNLMKFSKDKCKEEPLQRYRLRNDGQRSSSAEKDLGIQAESKVGMSQQCALAAKAAKGILGYINRVTARRLTGFWTPNARKTLTHWSKFSRDHQDGWGLELCEERLRELGLFGLEKRWICYQENGARLFTIVHGGRTRDNGHRLKLKRFRLAMRQSIFTMRTVKYRRQEGSWGGVLLTVLQVEAHQYHHIGAEDQMGQHPTKLAAVQMQSRRQSLPRK
ncbi:hypothetical protein QYF61_007163, partial [Mycteria americana]